MADKKDSSDKFTAKYGNITSPQCMRCKHRDAENPAVCKAFPDGIPVRILTNDADHKKPYSGDNGIQFEFDPDSFK